MTFPQRKPRVGVSCGAPETYGYDIYGNCKSKTKAVATTGYLYTTRIS